MVIRPMQPHRAGSAIRMSGWPSCAPRPFRRASRWSSSRSEAGWKTTSGAARSRVRWSAGRSASRWTRIRSGTWELPSRGCARLRASGPRGVGEQSDAAGTPSRPRRAAARRAVSPIPVATGEHVSNRVVFKQLLQAGAIDIMQIDACRVAGVNENIANLLLAAKFGVPVCPHAGGVGLCEMVQHLSMFDYAAVSGTMEGRMIEWIDHLHEHFTTPARVAGGRYAVPTAPGASSEFRPESVTEVSFPSGAACAAEVSLG